MLITFEPITLLVCLLVVYAAGGMTAHILTKKAKRA